MKVVQRHNMSMTMGDAFVLYKKMYPADKIGQTAFPKLRPVQVRKVSETSRRTCLCQICCNATLKSEALKTFASKVKPEESVLTSKQEIINITLCSYDNDLPRSACLNRTCAECRADKFVTRYKDLINGNELKEISWFRWEH